MADWYTQRGYWLSSMLIKVLLKECFEASLFLAVGMWEALQLRRRVTNYCCLQIMP